MTRMSRKRWRVIGQPFALPCEWLIQNFALAEPRQDNRWFPTRAKARAAARHLNRNHKDATPGRGRERT